MPKVGKKFGEEEKAALHAMGVNVDSIAFAMDGANTGTFTPSAGVPAQFGVAFLPGVVHNITAKMVADGLASRTVVGDFFSNEIVVPKAEHFGQPTLYSDANNTTYAESAISYEQRGVVRFEQGIQVGKLEEGVLKNANVSILDNKRIAASRALALNANVLAFFGYNDGSSQIYGLLNDPNLPSYITPPNGGWASATFDEITRDIRAMESALRVQSGQNADPYEVETTLAVASSAFSALGTTTTANGYSVREWIEKTYDGKMKVVAVPNFNGAHSGDNVAYLYANGFSDEFGGFKDTFTQLVPTSFMVMGTEATAKGVKEVYASALAGILCPYPLLAVRASGI